MAGIPGRKEGINLKEWGWTIGLALIAVVLFSFGMGTELTHVKGASFLAAVLSGIAAWSLRPQYRDPSI